MFVAKTTRNIIFCLAVLIAAPLLASARPKPSSQTEKKNITLNDAITVDGKSLAPGNYEVLIEGTKVSFERDGQMMASASCEWKALPQKSAYDDVVTSNNQALQEIDFEGSARALEIR